MGEVKKLKELSKKTKTHRHRQQYDDYPEGREVKGWDELGEGKKGINGDGNRLDPGW